MKSREPIRVAQIMGKWLGGGVEAVVMNYYRHLDRNKIQFDFICDSDSTNIPYEEIEALGGKVIIIPPYQKINKYIKELTKVLKENKYKIVHSHLNTLSVFPLYCAKKAKVPVRIAHSHSTTNKKEWKKNIMKQILRIFSKVFATHYFACTEHAGRWLFGNRTYDKGEVYLLNNAIDIEKFTYNFKIRTSKRKELGITVDTLVIGHVGRFMTQKNHTFLIDIFNEIYKQNKNTILLLIGQGPLEPIIKDKVNNLGLTNNVIFLGQRNDVNELYQAMDCFLFPSLYEGLGMVFVEAQVSGLLSIASTKVPSVAQVSDKAYFIDLNSPIELWGNMIKETKNINRKIDIAKLKASGYDIITEVQKLEQKYIDLYNK